MCNRQERIPEMYCFSNYSEMLQSKPQYTVGLRLSESRLSEPLIIRTVAVTVLIEYFVNRCVFY